MIRRDVVVIGGSLAGAACARELARLGLDVVALERGTFPRSKVCGGFVSPGAVDCLERLGVLDEVRAAGAVEISAARVAVEESQVEESQVDVRFSRPGLGISRTVLDYVMARGAPVQQGHAVREVRRKLGRFYVDDIECSVVIDAAGKLSRFGKRRPADEFGVQYLGSSGCGGVLEFSFFPDGYGGTVSIEGGRSNSCFLIKKAALRRYLGRQDCLVTGPLAYEKMPGDFIAIGDALGMLDPFCGEGMRHALDTGILAAQVIARGFRHGTVYAEMKSEYEAEYERRWMIRRMLGGVIRRLVAHRRSFASALRMTPAWLLNRMWD